MLDYYWPYLLYAWYHWPVAVALIGLLVAVVALVLLRLLLRWVLGVGELTRAVKRRERVSSSTCC